MINSSDWPLITKEDALFVLKKLYSEQAEIMMSHRLCGCTLFLGGRIKSVSEQIVKVEAGDDLSYAEIPLDQQGTEEGILPNVASARECIIGDLAGPVFVSQIGKVPKEHRLPSALYRCLLG